ncbi:MAG: hypothetical protein FDZ75_05700, partial [Actinobacteria bacterium]
MGLTVVAGASNTGKSGVLLRALQERDARARGFLILPSRPDVDRAREEFASRGVLGVDALTFDGWVHALWTKHGDGRQPLSEAVRGALVDVAIGRTELRALAASAATEGFRDL